MASATYLLQEDREVPDQSRAGLWAVHGAGPTAAPLRAALVAGLKAVLLQRWRKKAGNVRLKNLTKEPTRRGEERCEPNKRGECDSPPGGSRSGGPEPGGPAGGAGMGGDGEGES